MITVQAQVTPAQNSYLSSLQRRLCTSKGTAVRECIAFCMEDGTTPVESRIRDQQSTQDRQRRSLMRNGARVNAALKLLRDGHVDTGHDNLYQAITALLTEAGVDMDLAESVNLTVDADPHFADNTEDQ